MKAKKPLEWPPKVGQKFHCPPRGWSAEVRAIVDDDYAVIRRWLPHKGWHKYEILEKLDVQIGNKERAEPMYVDGPLPKAIARTRGRA